MELGLSGKTVLITASTAGIGRACAEAFLNEGANVVLNGRDRNKLENIKQDLVNQYGISCIDCFVGDMLDIDVIKDCRHYIENKWGKLDILVPNIGRGKPVSKNKLDLEEWEYLLNYNLLGTVNVIREFIELLDKGCSSNIVLISSIAACERGNAPYAYAAGKSGLLILNKYLAGDLAKRSIRINCVLPGNVYFENGRWDELKRESPVNVENFIKEQVPMQRFGTPEEIADAIVFLASERASFITGAELVIDGGQRRS